MPSKRETCRWAELRDGYIHCTHPVPGYIIPLDERVNEDDCECCACWTAKDATEGKGSA